MRAVVAERPGPLADVLALKDLPEPDDLARGEVLVRMVAAAVNPSDAVTVSGAYASRTSFPLVPGFEGVGVIERVGPGVPSEEVGRRVLPVGSAGCWAEYKRSELSWCVPVPDDLSDDVACFAYVNPLTAWLMVERFCSGGVRRVAVTAAGSTIAGHVAQLLSERGIAPIGLVRGTPGRSVAEPSLWEQVISTADSAWPELVRDASGGHLDTVLDCVGGPQGIGPAPHPPRAPGATVVAAGRPAQRGHRLRRQDTGRVPAMNRFCGARIVRDDEFATGARHGIRRACSCAGSAWRRAAYRSVRTPRTPR